MILLNYPGIIFFEGKFSRMTERTIDYKEIKMLIDGNKEPEFAHTAEEDAKRFHYLMIGDRRAVAEAEKLLEVEGQAQLSKDPLRSMVYYFIINTGLAARFMIETGIPQDMVYSISNLYIRKADMANSVEEIIEINREVWTVFVDTVKAFKKENLYSKPVWLCMRYVNTHFYQKLTLARIAEKLDINPNYLATMFKRETGMTFMGYLTDRRIYTSKALLSKTNYTFTEIANSLSFSSQSHFSKVFKEHTGFTPKEYRMKFYDAASASNK